MTILVLAVIFCDIFATVGFVLGYVATPNLKVGSVLLEQMGSPGIYGIVKVPKEPKRSIFTRTVFAFTAIGAIIGGGIGVVAGLAFRLPWG